MWVLELGNLGVMLDVNVHIGIIEGDVVAETSSQEKA